MFSKIRQRFTYANVALTLALVFAMSGGAYAANRYVVTSTKQIKPSVLKSLQGKAGPSGKSGANGTNGTNGAAGEKGAQGPPGPQGETGKQGEPGKTGEPGKDGETGFTETLPAKKTETGVWNYGTSAAGAVVAPISFTIPLARALDGTQVHYIGGSGSQSSECPGTVEEPEAKPGNLCVYQSSVAIGVKRVGGEVQVEIFPANSGPKVLGGTTVGAGASGALVFFEAEEEGVGWGTWAVTAPEG
jgi:hypothetical protein